MTPEDVLGMYELLGSWRAVGKALNVSPSVAWRFGKRGIEPKDQELRDKLGLDSEDEEITFIRQVRRRDGTFGRKK